MDGGGDEVVAILILILGGEELLQERDYLAALLIERLGEYWGLAREGRFGICGGELGVARGKAEAGVGLFSAAGGFIEDGAVDFGDQNVVVEAAVGVRCRGGCEGEGVKFGLG